MSSATFDPNAFRVADLFRAREEHRRRLARLPFEEKIKIVEKLQRSVSAAKKNEKLIFDSFLKICPDFAGEPIEEWGVVEDWYAQRALDPPAQPFDKRPAIITLTASGKRIGVELKSWVNRDQIASARKQERIQANIKNAIPESLPGPDCSSRGMRETLTSALLTHRSDPRYKDLRTRVGLDEVYLLVHYDFKAFAYNAPFDTANFRFRDAAKLASDLLSGDGGDFDRIFLFHFLWSREEACRIF